MSVKSSAIGCLPQGGSPKRREGRQPMNAFNIRRSWVNRRAFEDNRLQDKKNWQNAARSVSFRSASAHTSIAICVPSSTPYYTSSPRYVVRPRVYLPRVAIRGQARYPSIPPTQLQMDITARAFAKASSRAAATRVQPAPVRSEAS
jgi:hypothetical protein